MAGRNEAPVERLIAFQRCGLAPRCRSAPNEFRIRTTVDLLNSPFENLMLRLYKSEDGTSCPTIPPTLPATLHRAGQPFSLRVYFWLLWRWSFSTPAAGHFSARWLWLW